MIVRGASVNADQTVKAIIAVWREIKIQQTRPTHGTDPLPAESRSIARNEAKHHVNDKAK